MSYSALYRKYRPQTFQEVTGQNHITKTLKNQIISDRINHAYLFCGTRGTGKTSTAKIFAKAINCTDRQEGEPCGRCKTCLEINEQKNMNIFEIDAASNNGVDDVREIREELKYPPAEGKYKVYIIDEVHMFSASAFNALLKTLEEPPEHVIFILATTDPQKVPATILSRVQRFDFKRITAINLAERLRFITDSENVKIDEDAISYIAGLSDGAARDAISILEQCIAFYFNENITLEKVLETVGAVDNQVFFDFTAAIKDFDSKKALSIIDEIVANGRDVAMFTEDFMKHLRNMLLSQSLDKDILDTSIHNFEKLREFSKDYKPEILLYYINTFSELLNKMKYSQNSRILLEVAVIKLVNPSIDDDYSAFAGRFEKLENQILKLNKIIETGAVQISAEKKTEKSESETESIELKPKSIPEDIKKVVDDYQNFVRELKDNSLLNGFLKAASAGSLGDSVLYIVTQNPAMISLVAKHIPELHSMLFKKYGVDFSIKFISSDDFQKKHRELFGGKDTETEKKLDQAKSIKDNIDFNVLEINDNMIK